MNKRQAEKNLRVTTWGKWVLIFAVCTFFGLLSFSTFYTSDLVDDSKVHYAYRLSSELTAAYSFFVLLPLLLPFIARFPFTRTTWYRVLPAHLLASIAVGAAHTGLMTLSRHYLYPALDLGPYEMGAPLFRFVMEYQKQILLYAAVVVTVHLARVYRERRAQEKERADLELSAEQLRSRLAETQLQSLRGKLHPHFLFNSLNMISSLMYEDVAEADRMISRLSRLLRFSLDHASQQKVPLSEELSFTKAYLEIMQTRFQGKIIFESDVEGSTMSALVPSFLLQPLLENAIKHADWRVDVPLKLQLSVRRRADSLEALVSDNGPGFDQSGERLLEKGTGLRTTKDRLEQLYGDRHEFQLSNQSGGGAKVRIVVPLEHDERIRSNSKVDHETQSADC